MIIEYTNINHNKLHDELIANGIIPLLVENLNEKTWITYTDGTDMVAVQKIVDAHIPTTYPPLQTQEDYLLDLDNRMSMKELGV